MKMLAALSMIILSACAHGGRGPASDLRWEPLYGTYRFEGTLQLTPEGRLGETPKAALATKRVSGTLRLAEGRYSLTSTDGSCDGLLSDLRGVDVSFGCRDGVRISLRVMGKSLAPEGTAVYSEPALNEHEECRTDGNGNQICTTTTQPSRAVYRGRIAIPKVPGEG